MPNLIALKTEDAKVIYNGMTDVQRCAAMNVLMVSGSQAFSPTDARMALMFQTTIDWAYMCDVAEGAVTSADIAASGTPVTVTPTIRRAARQMRDLFSLDSQLNILTGTQQTLLSTGLAFLVTNKVISAAGQAAVLALNNTSKSFLSVVGLNQIQPIDLQIARGM